jgi:hypothetical protein
MNTYTDTTEVFTTTPGRAYVFAAESITAGTVSVAWQAKLDSATSNLFQTASGETEATFAGANESAGWVVEAPSNYIAVTVTGTVDFNLAKKPLRD